MNYKKAYEALKDRILNSRIYCSSCKYNHTRSDICGDCHRGYIGWKFDPRIITDIEKEIHPTVKLIDCKDIEKLRELVWLEDIQSPTVPEYVEHHESIKRILRFIDNELL